MNETDIDTIIETQNLMQICQIFGLYRNNLSAENDKFVKEQLQKEYNKVTKTYTLNGKTYTGTFKVYPGRENNRHAYEKEAKLATVLASLGFDVILIEEDNTKPGKKPDAIVNGIVMDFKKIEAKTEKEASKNRLGSDYRDGMRKKHTEGVVLLLHCFSENFVTKNMSFKQTRRGNNGLALFFHENTGKLQLIDMKKIRAAHLKQLSSRSAPSVTTEPADNIIIHSLSKKSSQNTKEKNSCLPPNTNGYN